jgi:hypothetical protein
MTGRKSMSRYEEIDLSKVKTLSIRNRKNKVEAGLAGRPVAAGGSFRSFWESLPRVLAAKELDALADAIVGAVRINKPVLFMMGAHVIKVGLAPVVVDWMEKGVLAGIALNGAGAVHDIEMAYFGATSEDVAEALKDGSFGMVRETSDLINGTVKRGVGEGLGFGEALGKRVLHDKPPFRDCSILGQAYRLGVPVTVHAALGTDIVHQHPSADGAALGEASMRDFRIFSSLVSTLHGGGVVLLFGSSVILPEVFLKALTVARNVRGRVEKFTTANFDMIRHYRPMVNVVERPTRGGGKGIQITGHHELMLPLLAAAVNEKMAVSRKKTQR